VSAGGVYAVAGLRGGNEEGEEWHRAGMLDRKQNVFDDFHAAAEALIRDGWTTAEQLAISGGSNGGLLVGAALTQRPDLYAAVVCSAPLLDMVRYERFGLGQTWNVEYGTASDAEQLGWLLAYSPYHHVTEGTRTRPCCSPCSPTTPGWIRCTRTRCAPRCSTPPPPGRAVRGCCGPRPRWDTGPGR
jgi:Serine proteases of the peptidase family S9A